MSDDLRYRIYNLQLSPEGYWEADVSINGSKAVPVSRKHGSWMTEPDADGWRKEVPKVICFELQRQVHKLEHPRPGARKEPQIAKDDDWRERQRLEHEAEYGMK